MLRKELRPLFVPLVCLFAPAWPVVAAGSGPVATFLSTTCIECHGPDVQEAGLRLDTLPLDPAKAAASADALRILVRVHDRVRDGEMPPADASQTSEADRRQFIAAIEPVITAAEAQAAAGTGRTTIRRMSRIE
ncbi:MAG: c-type cytochrome domain-containing protein, partial [Planctomycetota bacterium]